MKYHRYFSNGFISLIVILVGLLFLSNMVYAQYPEFVWAKRAGGANIDYGYGIATDCFDNSIITGAFQGTATFGTTTLTSVDDEDIFIAKYDTSGNILWAKQAGGINVDVGCRIAADCYGNIFITGYFRKTVTFDSITLNEVGGKGFSDIFIVKYDMLGNVLWAKQAGGNLDDGGIDIDTDESGNIIVTGCFQGTVTFGLITLTSTGKSDFFIAKYDASGNVLWAKQAGGKYDDYGCGIAIDGSGNSLVTGFFQDRITFGTIALNAAGGKYDRDIFVAKYDASGNVLWAKQAGGTLYDSGMDITTDRAGNSIVTGYFRGTTTFDAITLTSAGYEDIFIAKYDVSGYILWAKSAGGDSTDVGKGIVADNAGNIFLTGYFRNTAYYDDISLKSSGESEIFVTKYDESGNITWVERAGGTDDDKGESIAIDHLGNCMIIGNFSRTANFGSTSLKSSGKDDIFITKIIEKPVLANFTACPTQGIAPLSVQFTDLSQGNITSWLWDFGDETTSTQQNPVHVYDPQEDPKYTVCLTVTGPEGSDTETKVEYITVYLPVNADFDADRTVGPASFEVKFKNLTTGNADTYEWSFGDGCYSHEFEPSHLYDVPGSYNVYLKASGPGGKDCEHRVGFITVYADSGYLCLKFVKGSHAWWEEPWDNAIDGDTWGWDGTATVEGDTAYGIFEFKNQDIKKIDRFRLMSNTGVYFKDRWVKAFRVQISTTGKLATDFTTVLDTVKKDGEWETFKINPIDAKYVKLIIDEPAAGWRQVGEFEVWEHIVLPDPMLSTIVATSPHYSTGIDPSTINLTLKDEVGAAITGKAGKIKLYATGSDNEFSAVTETANPGIYTATLTTITPGVKIIGAKVQGIDIRFANPTDSTLCTVEFTELPLVLSSLKLVAYSNAYPSEDWTNAIDGDIKGWDGTVTATGWPPFAIFKLSDDGIHTIHKIRMMTDTGVRFADRWVTKFRVLVSTSGTNDSDFKLVLNEHQTTGDWQAYYFVMTDAKYVKLIIDEPNTTWRQLGEFEVYEMESPGPIFTNKFIVKSNESHSSLAPDRFALLQNYPNPFNPETTIRYDLAEAAQVTIVVYNIRGQEVKTLLDAKEYAGRYTINWDAKDNFGVPVTAGVYLYRIMAEYNGQLFLETKRMVLLR